MRKISIVSVVLCSTFATSFTTASAYAETWKQVQSPDKIREIIVDNALDGKYWKFYYRSDGRMAYEQGGFISVREWKIEPDGAICMNIYSMPDKSLGCEILSISDGAPVKYRLEGKTGRHTVEIITPDQALIDAVAEKAGPVE
jgi:hypothetical protein